MRVADVRRETSIRWTTAVNGRRWYTRDLELHRHPESWVLLDRPRGWRFEGDSAAAVVEAYGADLAREADLDRRAAEAMAPLGWDDRGRHPVAGRLYRSDGGWVAVATTHGLLRGGSRAQAARRVADALAAQAEEWRRLADALEEVTT